MIFPGFRAMWQCDGSLMCRKILSLLIQRKKEEKLHDFPPSSQFYSWTTNHSIRLRQVMSQSD